MNTSTDIDIQIQIFIYRCVDIYRHVDTWVYSRSTLGLHMLHHGTSPELGNLLFGILPRVWVWVQGLADRISMSHGVCLWRLPYSHVLKKT